MSLIGDAMTERKRILSMQTSLERMKGSNTTGYIPGERWKNTTLYLTNDSVTDGNGNKYNALQDSRGKPPASNPDRWELDESTPVYDAWASDDVGTMYYNGVDGIHAQTLRKHNSKNWKCVVNHQKAAGNAPRAGSELWEEVSG